MRARLDGPKIDQGLYIHGTRISVTNIDINKIKLISGLYINSSKIGGRIDIE